MQCLAVDDVLFTFDDVPNAGPPHSLIARGELMTYEDDVDDDGVYLI